MGIFDGDKERVVGTSVQRVVEDDKLPDTIKTSLVRAIMDTSETASIPEHLINGFANSIALKVARLYDWSDPDYTRGRPKSDLATNKDGDDVAKTIVELLVGYPITIDYFELAPLNRLHYGWQKLVEDHGYNPVTNILGDLTTSLGFDTYLYDLEVYFTEDSYETQSLRSLEQWGVPQTSGVAPDRQQNPVIGEYLLPSPIVTLDTATYDYVLVTYMWVDGDGVRQTGTFEIALPDYTVIGDIEYYHMKYRYTDGGAVQHIAYWTYERGSDLEPSMEAVHDYGYTTGGSFLPWLHFRHGNDNLGDVSFEGTPDFISSTKAADFYGMDYQEMCNAFNENPDIGDIEQIMMMHAVDVDDPSEVGMRYLFDYFDALWNIGSQTISPTSTPGYTRSFLQIIQDRDFKLTFRHGGIMKKRMAGTIAAIGKHARETVTVYAPKKKKGIAGALQTIIEVLVAENCYVWRRQISSSVYDEIRVYRPTLTYHIYGSDNNFTAGFNSDQLLIPLDYAIAGSYSLPDQETLLCRSMHFIYNTMQVVKTEWYQTGAFKAVMLIAAVVVSVYTGYDFVTSVMVALEAGAMAVVELLLTTIVIGLAVQYGVKLLIEAVGGELALIIAAVGTVVAIAYGQNGLAGLKGTPWAEDLLKVSAGIAKGVESEAKDLMGNLKEDYEQFQAFAEGKMKLLEEAKDLLKTSTLINPFEFVGQQPFQIWGERPRDYFDRTVHTGNIGMLSINAISGYVGAALTLPTLHDTLGDEINGQR